MAQAPRDANNVPAGLGVSNADGVTTLPFYIDSVTGRLLLTATDMTSQVGTLPTAPAKRDSNHVPTMLCVSNAGDGTLLPPIMDSRNGLLYVDFIFV